MKKINKHALVPYTATQMFMLVDDVASYPVPPPLHCTTLFTTVLSRTEDEVRASLDISHSGLHKSFTTLNRLQSGKMIEMRLLEGPFKHLQGFWRFEALGDEGCKVSLDLEFEFANMLVGLTFGPVFGQMAGTLVDAFTKRAKQIYG